MKLALLTISALLCAACSLPSYDKAQSSGDGGSGGDTSATTDTGETSTGMGGAVSSSSTGNPTSSSSSSHASTGTMSSSSSGGGTEVCEPQATIVGMDPCAGKGGTSMIRVPTKGGLYCIDATEVTNAQYDAFLKGATPAMTGECSWNTDFKPAGWMGIPMGKDSEPVVNVDWCDAKAYCSSVGKRLCGKIGGGAATYNEMTADPDTEQWYRACSAAGKRQYPYSASKYDAKKCNGSDRGTMGLMAAGTDATCEGGYCGLQDMAGNVAEWTDECDKATGPSDHCFALGGAFDSNTASCLALGIGSRNLQAPDVGFRCCAE